MAAKRSGPTPIRTSGSSDARAGSRATTRGNDLSAAAIASWKEAAISLKARYWSKRAKRISRASRRARSSSSSISPLGRSRAALRSSRVAAITRNSVAWSKRQPSPLASRERMKEMNSSVTILSETSVISSLWREINWRSRSKGPSKLSRWTLKALSGAISLACSEVISSVRASGSTIFSTVEHYFLTCSSPLYTRRVAVTEKRFLA